MKPRRASRAKDALTRTEVVFMILGLLIVVFFWVINRMSTPPGPMPHDVCVENLKQIGWAFREWEGDHNDRFPMQVSTADGGAKELIAAGDIAAPFQVLSNELPTPKVLICPEDKNHVTATNFSAINNSHVSYLVGLDANDRYPQRILSGDDNFAIGGVPVRSGLLYLWTNDPISWTAVRHGFRGNIVLSDDSVQQTTQLGLRQALQQTGLATNRLAIP
ncbi:MAG: type II secretion system protein [Verrucomicrobiota bacterium]|nr:type II secretion system protein [Verrucomicrobiota bacterium]